MSTSIHAADVDPPLPQLTPWNAFFWTAGSEGVLRMQRCSACGRLQHPPASRCALCKSASIEIVDLSGDGIVEAVTVNNQHWHPAFIEPYAVAIVALDEDRAVRLTTNVINVDPDDVAIGMVQRLLVRQAALANHFLDERMVGRNLFEAAVPDQVPAAVAHLRDGQL